MAIHPPTINITIDTSDVKAYLEELAGSGCGQIIEERYKQIHEKGFSAEHDDKHTDGSMAECAMLIIRGTAGIPDDENDWAQHRANHVLRSHGRIHQLSIAGALIAAEIDRITRLASSILSGSSEVIL